MPSLPAHLDRSLYPFEGKVCEVGGHRMHYLDEGEGDPVVLVHGNPTWSWMYRRLVTELAPHHRVIAVDHIGCGLSDKPDDDAYPYTLERRISDLETLLERIGATERISWVVHDWGGAIGLGAASRRPERARRIVVMNTSAFGLPDKTRFPPILWWFRHTPLGGMLIRGLNLFCRGTMVIGCRRSRIPAAVRAGYLAPYRSWESRRAILRFVEDIPTNRHHRSWRTLLEVEARLDRLREVPMQLFWGDRDPVFGRTFRLEWRKRFPALEATVFPRGGHLILEDAGEESAPRLARFLGDGPAAVQAGRFELIP